MKNMNDQEKNRKVVSSIGELVEALYKEVANLPLSEQSKSALITIMMGDVLKRSGRQITFLSPIKMKQTEVAA